MLETVDSMGQVNTMPGEAVHLVYKIALIDWQSWNELIDVLAALPPNNSTTSSKTNRLRRKLEALAPSG